MAKHEVIIRENTGATKTDAPYVPSYIKKSDLDFAAICSQVAAEAGLTDTQVRAIFEGAFAEFETMEKDAPVRIHIDGLTVCMVIYGSFPTSDAAFDPLKNVLALAIYLDDDVKNALVNVTPVIVTDETATKVRITGVADEEVPRPYEVIHGMHVFEVQGVNLVPTDVGGGVILVNGDGATFDCTIVEVVSKQKIRVKSARLLEGGDYKLYVKSRGGDAEGPLQTPFRKVKYLKVIDEPTITKVATAGKDGIVKGEAFDIEGTNLRYNEGDYVKAKWNAGGTAGEQLLAPTTVTATKMSFAAVSGFDTLPDNTELTFEVTIDETRVSAPTVVSA